jgi:hypothetical protein
VRALALVALAIALAPTAAGQSNPRDQIDRNLQQRAAREREFGVRLEEDRTLPPPITAQPGTGLKFYVPTPGSEILGREPAPAAHATPRRVEPAPAVVDSRIQLEDSQQRRQTGLQSQTQQIPEPQRQQMLDTQKLQFERETQAQDLGSRILRDSERAMGR